MDRRSWDIATPIPRPASWATVKSYGILEYPKDPCTYIVYTWALKGFLYSSFRAQVHGSLGILSS